MAGRTSVDLGPTCIRYGRRGLDQVVVAASESAIAATDIHNELRSTSRCKSLLTGCRAAIPIDAIQNRDHALARSNKHFVLNLEGDHMGRGILLWMLGVPLPIILLLAMCSHR
jgi:hypothetical protein